MFSFVYPSSCVVTLQYLYLILRKIRAGYPSGTPVFTPVFSGVRVARSVDLCVVFGRLLSFCSCIVCSSSIYGFGFSPFGIFKHFLDMVFYILNTCIHTVVRQL